MAAREVSLQLTCPGIALQPVSEVYCSRSLCDSREMCVPGNEVGPKLKATLPADATHMSLYFLEQGFTDHLWLAMVARILIASPLPPGGQEMNFHPHDA